MTYIQKIILAPGYEIPRVIKGGWQLAGGHGNVDKEKALSDMKVFYDSGINAMDCADIYTGVEELIGTFRAKYSVKDLKIHTKFVPDLNSLDSISEEYVLSAIHRSLQRLKVKSLDLIQFHWWDFAKKKYVQTFKILQGLQQKGLIKHLGLTNFDVEHTKEIIEQGKIISNQIQYSILDQRAENGMVELAQKENFKLICYGTVAGGFLSEKYLNVPEPTLEELENRSLVKYKLIIDEFGGWKLFQKLMTALKEIAEKHKVDIATIASKYILEKPQVSAIIIGARNVSHIEIHKKLFSFDLDESDYEQLNLVISKKIGPVGDIYGLEQDSKKHSSIMKYNLNNIKN